METMKRTCVHVFVCMYRGTDEWWIGYWAVSPAQAPQQCHHEPTPEHLSHTIDWGQQSGNTCVYTWEVNIEGFQLLISVGGNSSLPAFAAAAGSSFLPSVSHLRSGRCSGLSSVPVFWEVFRSLTWVKEGRKAPSQVQALHLVFLSLSNNFCKLCSYLKFFSQSATSSRILNYHAEIGLLNQLLPISR